MDKESRLSPCRINKEEMTKWLQGYLESNEYISDWSLDSEDFLYFIVKVKDAT